MAQHVVSWLRDDRVSEGEDLELLNGSPVLLGCGVGALLQPRTGLSYGADGKGLPGPVS